MVSILPAEFNDMYVLVFLFFWSLLLPYTPPIYCSSGMNPTVGVVPDKKEAIELFAALPPPLLEATFYFVVETLLST